MKNKIFSILLALTMVMVGTIGASITVSANNDTNNTPYTLEDFQKVQEMRIEAVEKAYEGIQKLASQSQRLRLDTVYLGTDKTYSSRGWGLYWCDTTGTPTGALTATSNLQNKTAEAEVDYNAGYGGGAAYSYIGNQFTVSGSGSQWATIRFIGNYTGEIRNIVLWGGEAAIKIDLVVKDDTTGTESSTTLLNSSTTSQTLYWNNNFDNSSLTLNLQAGHSYSAYISVEASVAIAGAGWAYSDWGTQFNGNECVTLTSISIDF